MESLKKNQTRQKKKESDTAGKFQLYYKRKYLLI